MSTLIEAINFYRSILLICLVFLKFPYDPRPPLLFCRRYGRCVCNADYNGPRCEFLVVNNVQECNFQCQNGGTCFFGDKSSNMDSMVHIGNSKMNCKCPEGFSGTLCEIDICGGKHVCMNNGVCKSTVEEKEG